MVVNDKCPYCNQKLAIGNIFVYSPFRNNGSLMFESIDKYEMTGLPSLVKSNNKIMKKYQLNLLNPSSLNSREDTKLVAYYCESCKLVFSEIKVNDKKIGL